MLTKEMCNNISKVLDFDDLISVVCRKIDQYDLNKECCLKMLSMVISKNEMRRIIHDDKNMKVGCFTGGLVSWLCNMGYFPGFDETSRNEAFCLISSVFDTKEDILHEFASTSLCYNFKITNPCIPESFGIRWIREKQFELAVLDCLRKMINNEFRTYSVVDNVLRLAQRKKMKEEVIKKKIWNVLVKFLEQNGDE